MDALTVRQASPDESGVRDMAAHHFTQMRALGPEESCHCLPPEKAAEAYAAVFIAEGPTGAVAIGAFSDLGEGHAEIKTMHTLDAARGKGLGRQILENLIKTARAQGYRKISLETGSAPEFAAARALYEAHGFTECPPFGSYVLDPFSTFYTRSI